MPLSTRNVAIGFSALRIAYGAGLLAAPARVARSWIGSDAGSAGGSVAIRGLGGRDLALAAGVAHAAWRGDDARPWLVATVVGDLSDLAGTLLAPKHSLPDKAKPGTVALAGGFGAAAAFLATREDLAG